MKNNNPPTVEQLNDIQSKWMALQSSDPNPVKSNVFKLMELFPNRYLSVSEDGNIASVVLDGQPFGSEAKPVKDALKILKDCTTEWNKNRTRFDIGWCGKTGQWITLSVPVS